MTTAEEVVDAVRTHGAGIWPNFVDGQLLADLQQQSSSLLAGKHALHFPKSTRVWDLYRHDPCYRALLTLPRIGQLIAELLGEQHILSDYSLNAVGPDQPNDDWHVDYPFNEMSTLIAGSVLGVQCVLTLDDFTVANGGTLFVPDSHNPPRRPDSCVELGHQVFEAQAGTLLVLAASTWHRSGRNTTSARRVAILLSFVERWIRPMVDPPEPGPWSSTEQLRLLLGMQRPPETINGVVIESAGKQQ